MQSLYEGNLPLIKIKSYTAYECEDDLLQESFLGLWKAVHHYESFLHNKSMAQVAREQGLSFDAVRQIKAKGLRKLRIGRARRELIEKFDIAEAKLFRDGLNNYREHGFTSMVEHLVLKRLEAQERYQRHLAKIEEIHRNRLVRNSEKLDLPSDEGESEVRHYVESER